MKEGERYIIEISDVIATNNGNIAKIKGFNALVFDEDGLKKLEQIERSSIVIPPKAEPELHEPQVGDVYKSKSDGSKIIITYNDMGMYMVLLPDGDNNYYDAEELNKHYDFVENRADLLEPIKGVLA